MDNFKYYKNMCWKYDGLKFKVFLKQIYLKSFRIWIHRQRGNTSNLGSDTKKLRQECHRCNY